MRQHHGNEPTVSKIDTIGPTHAQGLEWLVGVHSNIRQGDPLSDMRLDFDATCGIVPLQISDRDYEMGLKTCFVSLDRQNCSLHPHSSYEYWLGIGAFKASEVQKITSGHSKEAGAAVNLNLDSVKGVAGLKARFGLGASRKRNEKTEALTEQSERIELVVTSGQDRWRVGDRYRGDARRPDGLLSGEYFGEQHEHNDPKPLCRLQWDDHATSALITITISASLSSLLIFAPTKRDAEGNNVAAAAWTILRRRSAQVSKKHEATLRAHVAGLAVAKRIQKAQQKAGEQVLPNEFIILRLTLIPLHDGDSISPNESV
jgi:hypothetical protein